MPVTLFMTTMVLYLAGTVFFLAYLLRRSEALSKVSLAVTGIGFVSHTAALATRMTAAGHVPLTSFYEAMSFFSWALVLVFLVVEIR
ncbi:MAG: c-type cytochrome biogenesis protein CcsB, partial [Nitrospiraceae bacterium]